MTDVQTLKEQTLKNFASWIQRAEIYRDELTLEVDRHYLRDICFMLRDKPKYNFQMLVDVCGIDYLHYGYSEWQTESTTATGFSRGVNPFNIKVKEDLVKPARFAVVYHLLSLDNNQRIRLRAYVDEEQPIIDSVTEIWPSANWFEREAFDLYGIMFKGHPDLRRILTDYGFIGHPFRKDFPLIGNLEIRYDATQKRVIYEPVSIEPRILEPKVIRKNNNWSTSAQPAADQPSTAQSQSQPQNPLKTGG
jgi:NADH-quinone oxidoreductase subunit C